MRIHDIVARACSDDTIAMFVKMLCYNALKEIGIVDIFEVFREKVVIYCALFDDTRKD